MAVVRNVNETRNVNSLNRMVALVLGIVLVLVGLLGFVMTPTLIIFGVNATHNVIHLLTGAVLLFAWWYEGGTLARPVNMTLGIVYLAVALLGYAGILVPDLLNTNADGVPHADNTLHLLLGIVLLGASFVRRDVETRRMTGTAP